MRGKIVNLCLGFLNLLFGVLIVLFTIKVPQDKTLLTVQEGFVVKYIVKGIYAIMFAIAFIDLIQSHNHKSDTTFNVGYIIGVFAISFLFIKHPFIGIFNIISGLIILFKSLKENLIELDSTFAISVSIVLMASIMIAGFFSLNYSYFGQRIKNKENKNETQYKADYFKYVTELDITDVYINVEKDGKFGYINQQGETVIDFKYDYASPFIKITEYGKNFYIALMCENGSTYVNLKNGRTVLSYRTESADENFEAKKKELEDVYYNILKQQGEIEYEISANPILKNRVPIYTNTEDDNVKRFDYNSEYDLTVSQSGMGKNDIYELVKKGDESIKIKLDADNLDYDDEYLYLFDNGYIPYYEVSKAKQGWFTDYGKKEEMTGRAQILEFFYDNRILIKHFKDNSIYFATTSGEKLSSDYYDIYICKDGRYIVKDKDNFFTVIDNDYNQILNKKYSAINTRFVSQGLYLALDSTDGIKFNDYGYAIMNWTLINYAGEEIATNIQYIYDLDLKIDKVKNIDEENYLIFINNLKKLNGDFVGDKFYYKKAVE